MMCRMLKVARSGFYKWLHKPHRIERLRISVYWRSSRTLMMPAVGCTDLLACSWIYVKQERFVADIVLPAS